VAVGSSEVVLLFFVLLLDGLAALSDLASPLFPVVGDSAVPRGDEAGVMLDLLLPVAGDSLLAAFFEGLAAAPVDAPLVLVVAVGLAGAFAVAVGDAVAVAVGETLAVAVGDAVAVAVGEPVAVAVGDAVAVAVGRVEAPEPVVAPVVVVVLPETPTLTPTLGVTP